MIYKDRREAYQAYMKSQQWADKRAEMLSLVDNRCWNDDVSIDEYTIQIHHRTLDYSWFCNTDNWGTEVPFKEILPLCIECHKAMTARRQLVTKYREGSRDYTSEPVREVPRALMAKAIPRIFETAPVRDMPRRIEAEERIRDYSTNPENLSTRRLDSSRL